MVVVSVKLVDFEIGDVLGDDATKTIGIDVEDGNVNQDTELCGEEPDNIGDVKVNANDDVD